jgi:hypothetical protein
VLTWILSGIRRGLDCGGCQVYSPVTSVR